AQMREEIERLAAARHPPLFDEDSPRNVAADHGELFSAEHLRVSLVGEHGEERLLVRHLAAQRVGHADSAMPVRIEQRATLTLARDDVVDEDAAVVEIDALAVFA